MYQNFGDKNITSGYGRLLEQHDKHHFSVTTIEKWKDEKFRVCECYVDTKEPFIDKDDVYLYANIDFYSPCDLAIGCVDYYGIEAFSKKSHRYIMTKDELKDYINKLDLEDDVEI